MSKFSYHWTPLSLTIESLILEGNLDQSADPKNNPEVKKLQDQIKTKSASKVIIVDLQKFGAWATEGIRAIIEDCIEPLVISKNPARIGFLGPKEIGKLSSGEVRNSQLFADASLKVKSVRQEILPWEETLEAVCKKLGVQAP